MRPRWPSFKDWFTRREIEQSSDQRIREIRECRQEIVTMLIPEVPDT